MSSATASNAANETLKELEEFKKKSAQEIECLRADLDAKAKMLRESDRTNNRLQEEVCVGVFAETSCPNLSTCE